MDRIIKTWRCEGIGKVGSACIDMLYMLCMYFPKGITL